MLKGTLSPRGTLTGSLSARGSLSAVLTGGISTLDPLPYYNGEYAITPSTETQTLLTANKSMAENIVVNPIPSNYGRIEYSGGIITII